MVTQPEGDSSRKPWGPKGQGEGVPRTRESQAAERHQSDAAASGEGTCPTVVQH